MQAASALAVPVALIWLAAAPAAAQERLIEEGRASYLRYCAACHGKDGTGNGPVAGDLETKPADLTDIRARYGGRWPYSRLRDIIDGRRFLSVHGPREMPVWGKRFTEERGGGPGSEGAASAEITALLEYLKSIQREPASD